MSDLKKILKEEYDKKKLNITPKLLMEMIYDELRLLKEVGLTPKQMFKPGSGRFETFLKKVQKGEPFTLTDNTMVVIDKDNDDTILYIQTLKDYPKFKKMPYNFKMVTTDGRRITSGKIKKTKEFGGGGNNIGNPSEKYEGNIILALNGTSATTQGFVGNTDYLVDPGLSGLSPAIKVIKSINPPPDIVLPPGKKYYKPKNAKELTELYDSFGVGNKTPKTDIASKDEPDEFRISVKKKGASFLSSEVGETQALVAVALGLRTPEELSSDSSLDQFFNDLSIGLSKTVWNAPDVDRRKLGDEALIKIYNQVMKTIGLSDFQKKLATEAMSGEHRFIELIPKANKLLVWGADGSGYFDDLAEWVSNNFNQFKYDIRWRGRDRSAGYRIDSSVGENFLIRMNSLYESTEVNEQLSTATASDDTRPSVGVPVETEMASPADIKQILIMTLYDMIKAADVYESSIEF